MKSSISSGRIAALVFGSMVLASGASAGVAEAAKSAASATHRVGNQADNAIRRGIRSGNQAADNASKSADGPVDRAARKIGLPRGPTKPVNNEREVTR